MGGGGGGGRERLRERDRESIRERERLDERASAETNQFQEYMASELQKRSSEVNAYLPLEGN